MKTYNKYSRFHKKGSPEVSIQCIPRGTKYIKRPISLPEFVNNSLVSTNNVSGYIAQLIIRDKNLRIPFTESQLKQFDEEMKDFK